MTLHKVISTALIGTMLFFAPSLIPARAVQIVTFPCGVPNTWLATDTAFASVPITPCPVGHSHVPAWPWVVIGCAGSIIVSALAANFWSHRELTTPEAWTCGLLYWVPMPNQPQPVGHQRH